MEILLATNNMHKRDELALLLKGHRLILPAEAGYRFSCEETGKTYYENALIKGETLFRLCGRPVLADDSGLSVTALEGAPGLHSARFGELEAGRNLSDREKYLLLLDKMKGERERSAFFVCCLIFIAAPWRICSVQETLPGVIMEAPSGSGGFGYDPVFRPEGYDCSLAALSPEEKNRISHRGRAGVLILNHINGIAI